MKDKSYSENLKHERLLLESGKYKIIAGVDEVGRGCFSGPVVAAAVIMKPYVRIPYLTDSKKIPKSQHAVIVEEIKKNSLSWAISVVDAGIIDEINIRQATLKAMKKAVESLEIKPEFILVDGSDTIPYVDIPQQNIIQGDYFSHTISAASLLAKKYRDNLMVEYDKQFNDRYEWAKNAGYPTARHIELVNKYGLTGYHRKSWKTMDKIIKE